MSLIVEDGTGRADAESLCSVEVADDYHAKRGNTTWTPLDDATKEAALRKATDFMAAYRDRYAGVRTHVNQALDWPRYAVPMKDVVLGGYTQYYDYQSVPQAVQNACAELALKSLTITLAPDLKPPKTMARVGTIQAHYAQGDRQYTIYRQVELMLMPFFESSGGINAKVVRA